MTTLVILESPTKAPTIKRLLGKGYKVVASQGHVRDLPKSKLGINIENDFEPVYINIRGKGDLIKALKKEAKQADRVLLATDPDREGEAISWHLAAALDLDSDKVKRITFNEITQNALIEALKNPRDIDISLVNAQQTRRILDRLVGYKISPFLWKMIKSGLSAGRVQSVTTRIIVERDDEIKAFISEEYWTIGVKMENKDGDRFAAKFYGNKNKKIDLNDKNQTDEILAAIRNAEFAVSDIKKAVKNRKPQPPFTTSTMQQEVNRRLGFQSQKTMKIAQELYEGVSLGDRITHGLITYMRTDSQRISNEARDAAAEFIKTKFGAGYYPEKPNEYKTKSNSQDAHEAIRPSDPSLLPEEVRGKLSSDQFKLYKLIWERFVASQMKPMELDTVSVDICAGDYIFKSSGFAVKFKGYTVIYDDMTEDDDEKSIKLPDLTVGEKLIAVETSPVQHFTSPPPKFTEGTLIKILEEKGIGRPSTITPTITTILSRGYVVRNGKFLDPTELGRTTTKLMMDSFPDIIDYNFTAKMEDDLDKIETNNENYLDVLKNFYAAFEKSLTEAESKLGTAEYKKPIEYADFDCEKCGEKMVIREGKFGKFAACSGFPKCRNTKNLDGEKTSENAVEVKSDEKCPTCGKDMLVKKGAYGTYLACIDYPDCKTTKQIRREASANCPKCGKKILIKQSKSKKLFYACEGYPDCDFSVWDIPQEEKCPNCNGLVLKKKSKESFYCANKECGWSK